MLSLVGGLCCAGGKLKEPYDQLFARLLQHAQVGVVDLAAVDSFAREAAADGPGAAQALHALWPQVRPAKDCKAGICGLEAFDLLSVAALQPNRECKSTAAELAQGLLAAAGSAATPPLYSPSLVPAEFEQKVICDSLGIWAGALPITTKKAKDLKQKAVARGAKLVAPVSDLTPDEGDAYPPPERRITPTDWLKRMSSCSKDARQMARILRCSFADGQLPDLFASIGTDEDSVKFADVASLLLDTFGGEFCKKCGDMVASAVMKVVVKDLGKMAKGPPQNLIPEMVGKVTDDLMKVLLEELQNRVGILEDGETLLCQVWAALCENGGAVAAIADDDESETDSDAEAPQTAPQAASSQLKQTECFGIQLLQLASFRTLPRKSLNGHAHPGFSSDLLHLAFDAMQYDVVPGSSSGFSKEATDSICAAARKCRPLAVQTLKNFAKAAGDGSKAMRLMYASFSRRQSVRDFQTIDLQMPAHAASSSDLAPVDVAPSTPTPPSTLEAGEEAMLRRMFDRCDTSGDQKINKRELIKLCRSDAEAAEFFGLPANIRQEDGSRERFESKFQRMDENDDREISWEEFRKFYLAEMKNVEPPGIQRSSIESDSGPAKTKSLVGEDSDSDEPDAPLLGQRDSRTDTLKDLQRAPPEAKHMDLAELPKQAEETNEVESQKHENDPKITEFLDELYEVIRSHGPVCRYGLRTLLEAQPKLRDCFEFQDDSDTEDLEADDIGLDEFHGHFLGEEQCDQLRGVALVDLPEEPLGILEARGLGALQESTIRHLDPAEDTSGGPSAGFPDFPRDEESAPELQAVASVSSLSPPIYKESERGEPPYPGPATRPSSSPTLIPLPATESQRQLEEERALEDAQRLEELMNERAGSERSDLGPKSYPASGQNPHGAIRILQDPVAVPLHTGSAAVAKGHQTYATPPLDWFSDATKTSHVASSDPQRPPPPPPVPSPAVDSWQENSRSSTPLQSAEAMRRMALGECSAAHTVAAETYAAPTPNPVTEIKGTDLGSVHATPSPVVAPRAGALPGDAAASAGSFADRPISACSSSPPRWSDRAPSNGSEKAAAMPQANEEPCKLNEFSTPAPAVKLLLPPTSAVPAESALLATQQDELCEGNGSHEALPNVAKQDPVAIQQSARSGSALTTGRSLGHGSLAMMSEDASLTSVQLPARGSALPASAGTGQMRPAGLPFLDFSVVEEQRAAEARAEQMDGEYSEDPEVQELKMRAAALEQQNHELLEALRASRTEVAEPFGLTYSTFAEIQPNPAPHSSLPAGFEHGHSLSMPAVELPPSVSHEVKALYEDVRALQARTVMLEADNTELLEHISLINAHARHSHDVPNEVDQPEPTQQQHQFSTGHRGVPAQDSTMQATSCVAAPVAQQRDHLFSAPLVNISFGGGQNEAMQATRGFGGSQQISGMGAIDQTMGWGTSQAAACRPPSNPAASFQDIFAAAMPAAIQNLLTSSLSANNAQNTQQQMHQEQMQQMQQQMQQLQQQLQQMQQLQLQQMQYRPPAEPVQVQQVRAPAEPASNLPVIEVRSLVSELRNASRALGEEMLSVAENMREQQRSAARQATMPSMPPAITSGIGPGHCYGDYYGVVEPCLPALPAPTSGGNSFRDENLESLMAYGGNYYYPLPPTPPQFDGEPVSNIALNYAPYQSEKLNSAKLSDSLNLDRFILGKTPDEDFSVPALTPGSVSSAPRWDGHGSALRSGRGLGRRGQPGQPLQHPSRPAALEQQMACIDSRLENLDVRLRHFRGM